MRSQERKSLIRSLRNGFTLTEIIVVMAIISVLVGVSGGVYTGTYKKLMVEKAARAFLLTAQYAKIMAIENQQRYQIYLDIQNNAFYLVTTEWNEEYGETQERIVRDYYCKPFEMEGNVMFEDLNIPPMGAYGYNTEDDEDAQTILFLPDGTAQASIVQIGDGKTHYSIGINPASGRVKIYEGDSEDVKMGIVDLDAER